MEKKVFRSSFEVQINTKQKRQIALLSNLFTMKPEEAQLYALVCAGPSARLFVFFFPCYDSMVGRPRLQGSSLPPTGPIISYSKGVRVEGGKEE